MNSEFSNQVQELRQRAQERLNSRTLEAQQELQLHQTELEIQHEELRRAYSELSNLYEEYWYLYQFAPCGYVTLNHNRIITRINIKAVELLGLVDCTPKNCLGFSRFIACEHQDLFLNALQQLQHSVEIQNLELQLMPAHQSRVWVALSLRPSIDLRNEVRQWQITLTELNREKQEQ